MSLDLGAVVARVVVEDAEFQRMIARDIGLLRDFGAQAGGASGSTAKLDEGLVAVAASASRASTALGRGAKSAAEIAAADQKAAAAADSHAVASDRLAVIMSEIADMTPRQQRAVLALVSAEERLAQVTETDTATFRQLVAAQSAAIGADERLTAAHDATAAAAEREAAAMRSSTTASRATVAASAGAAGGLVKTAAQLGLIVGGIELVKKALDISHEATQFQADMVKIQTQAGASASEVKQFSGAILKLAPDVAQAPEALATSLYHVYSATKTLGYTLPQMLEATRIAGEGATASGADLEATTNALTATMVSGLGDVNNMGKAMGALNAIVGAGDMKLSDLNEALGTGILAALKVFGVSLEQGGAALAVFGDNNIRGAEAATKLRMVVQDLSKPAAHADDVLTKLGLSSARLRDDLEKGGLSLALHDLKTHLEEAGVTGSKVGPLIEDAFTKKAGVGLAVLLNNLDQYDQKQAQITRGAGKFGDQWTATTQTARYALTRLWTELEAGGIVLASKVTPEIATAATWIGTTLPHAIGALVNILEPAVHLVGVELVGAWHAAYAVIAPIVHVLSSVAHYLADSDSAGHRVTTTLLEMFVAFKSLQVSAIIFGVMSGGALRLANALIGIPATLIRIAAGMKAVAVGETAMALGPFALAAVAAGVALYELGSHISDYLERNNSMLKVLPNLTADTNNWRDALVQSNGELTKAIALSVEKQLQDSGLAKKAAAAGISLTQLTQGVVGNDKAFTNLIATWRASGAPSDATITAAGLLHLGYSKASSSANELSLANNKLYQSIVNMPAAWQKTAQASRWAAIDQKAYLSLAGTAPGLLISMTQRWISMAGAQRSAASTSKQAASALHWVVDTSGNLVQTTGKVTDAADAATAALQAQTRASAALKQMQDLLNGVNESVETSTDSLSIAVGNLANKTSLATGANGKASTSLNQSTVAGATNRQMLVGLIDAAKAQAQATADQAAKHHTLAQALVIGNNKLADNEQAIRVAAKAAGLDKDAVNTLINSLGILSKVKAVPTVDVNTAPAKSKIADAQQNLDDIHQRRGIYLHLDNSDLMYAAQAAQNRLDALHDKTIYLNVQQRVLGAPIPHATGGYGGPMLSPALSAARTVHGMIYGAGTGTSDQAGIYKLSAKEFVSTAASVARNAGALEAGNRGATLVAIDGMTRKLIASSARASVPVRAPMAVAAPAGAGMDLSPLTSRLDAIERRLAEVPERTGAAVGAATLDGYREAGSAFARQNLRDWRGR